MRFSTEKNRRLDNKKARYNRAFHRWYIFLFITNEFELSKPNKRLYMIKYSLTITYNSQYFNISARFFISSIVSCQYFRLCEFVRVGLTQSVRAPDLYTWASLNEFPTNKISFAGIANLSPVSYTHLTLPTT